MISRWLTTRPKKYRRKVKSDPNRHKVYSLEREIIGTSIHTRSSRDHLRDVLSHACKKYKVTVPNLRFVNNPNLQEFGSYDDPPPTIILNQGFHGANMPTLLHELSHHITDELYHGAQDHGPEFVKVYMDLLDRYRIIPAYLFKVMLERHGVKY